MTTPKIITIDGPSGAGKGTVAYRLAEHFGFELLDSGALYRIVGLMAFKNGLLDGEQIDEQKVAKLTRSLNLSFRPNPWRYSYFERLVRKHLLINYQSPNERR